jgi:hypothetical protein
MIRIGLALSALSLSFAAAGCAVAPFDAPVGEAGYPKVNQVLDKIQCEIAEARDDQMINGENITKLLEKQNLKPFKYWVASVILTLTVDDTEGLTPTSSGLSLSVIDPFKSAMNSFGFGGSVILYQQRSRTFTEQYSLQIEKIPPQTCGSIGRRWHNFNLEGDLGLQELIYTGLHSFDESTIETSSFESSQAGHAQEISSDESASDGSDKQGSADGFGGTVSFDIFKGVTAVGPTWTLVKAKTTGGVGLQRDDLHKIVISFVPVALSTAKATEQTQDKSVSAAKVTAQNLTQSLAERHLLNSIVQAINKP